MKINQILDKIDEHQLFVPAFQREFVWKRDDAKKLISSMLRDYPTGTMLTWETNSPPELKGEYAYDHNKGSVKLILDGQQRITTLYLLIKGEIPPYYKTHEIINDVRGLYVNIVTLELEYYKKTIMSGNPFWIDITRILKNETNALQIIKAIKDQQEINDENQYLVLENIGKIEQIKNKEFLEQTIPVKAEIREAIDIFYIVNASGVNLTDAELALAQISGYWPDARERIKTKLFELEKEGWVFKLDFFMYVLLGCLHQVGSKMEKLHGQENLESLKEAWLELESNTLDYVFNILKSHAYIDHTKEINSVYALVPIIVYTFRKEKSKMSETEIKKAVKWFYYSQVRNRYVSQLPQKLDKDLSIIANEKNPFDKLLNLIEAERRLEIHSDEFIGVGVQHPLWALMNWYLKSKNAKCLTTGLCLRKNMGKKYSLEWDHIFPFSILKKNGYGWENRHKYSLAQEITNRAILTKTANRTKSNKEAKAYLSEVQLNFPNALELQSIPTDNRLWELENYEQFLQTRRKLLASQFNEYLNNITTTLEEPLSMNVEELINQGENSSLELKTTLRWDLKTNQVNKKLEEVVLKTVAGFSNGEGGTLIIGVTDEGEIEGLHHDYATLNNGDKDKFEIHLRNLLNKEYGVEFSTNNLKISFPEVDDKELCLVEIIPGLKPLYTTISDSNGNKSQRFYVRSGNSSQEVGIEEVAEFILKRFEK
ncbi:MAG: DUF262 domain-containing protein [Candidatus Scalindua rubra]|uniref:Divergent AAA domain protein n=1 Tax=Candidatus Scalindua brodae TaxID=237368 RepID=A0A0B0EMQ4_9BACT|nr:MAG: Divergent AAA domain protein [Candidatus Scalindua brodae]MBZ0107192.1 DUF262 domain-containing protein [Candidatus Scalindua rubra]TWU31630.1 Divergent AAA domain protein [Candidatus Brocadiaceae bacterium S225]